MGSHHDPRLVALSVIIAVIASYAALDLAGRVAAAQKGARAIWLIGGAIAMGLGIWSMHYIGMLAFHLPVPVLYDVPTVVASLLAAIFASAVALWVVSRQKMGLAEAIPASVVMGIGISAMHYTGMAAMRLPAAVQYDRRLVALSVAIAIVVSFVALDRFFSLRGAGNRGSNWRKIWSAVLMGAAIPSMHYTAMAAARFSPTGMDSPGGHGVAISILGAAALAASTLVVLALAIVTSVVDRRMSAQQAALQTSDQALQLLRRIIDTTPHLVFVKDQQGRFTLANRAIAEVYGTTPEKLEGKTEADFNHNAEEVKHFLEDDNEVMSSLRQKDIPEEPLTNGKKRWFQTVKVPLFSTDGTAQHVLGVATDITDRKHLEDQLRQAQKMEAVGRLAGGVAHDFNNLLTVIIGHTDLLLDDPDAGDERRSDLTEIKRASERAAGLTRQLLAYSRKQFLQPTVLDLNVAVAAMDQLLRTLIGENVRLSTVLAPGLGAIEADRVQLEQVIMNLAVNARDAMPNGGRLTIETENVELDQSNQAHPTVRPGSYVALTVSDTGSGMDEETKSHLFEPFFTTKEQGKGTGLGLATVYGIVKQSGGFIWAHSEPGRGSRFTIYQPRVLATAPAGSLPQDASSSLRGSETILVVEDEEGVRKLTCRSLGGQGYTILRAECGQEALRVAEEYGGTIDLLVTDVVMPGMSGPELVERIALARPETKVLYLSGYADDAVNRHGVPEPGVILLQKPFTQQVLARKVREVLTGNSTLTAARELGAQ